MKKKINLKPCPFCGSKDIAINGFNNIIKEYFVWCKNCKCMTDEVNSTKKAIELWNMRTE